VVEVHRRDGSTAIGAVKAFKTGADASVVVAFAAVRAVHVANVAVAPAAAPTFRSHVVAVRLILLIKEVHAGVNCINELGR
jgi:hypothetical protein